MPFSIESESHNSNNENESNTMINESEGLNQQDLKYPPMPPLISSSSNQMPDETVILERKYEPAHSVSQESSSPSEQTLSASNNVQLKEEERFKLDHDISNIVLLSDEEDWIDVTNDEFQATGSERASAQQE